MGAGPTAAQRVAVQHETDSSCPRGSDARGEDAPAGTAPAAGDVHRRTATAAALQVARAVTQVEVPRDAVPTRAPPAVTGALGTHGLRPEWIPRRPSSPPPGQTDGNSVPYRGRQCHTGSSHPQRPDGTTWCARVARHLEHRGSRSGSHTDQRAWVGERRAARSTGMSPATTPMMSEAVNPPTHASVGMTVAQPLVCA